MGDYMSLIFDDEELDKLVQATNEYAELFKEMGYSNDHFRKY